MNEKPEKRGWKPRIVAGTDVDRGKRSKEPERRPAEESSDVGGLETDDSDPNRRLMESLKDIAGLSGVGAERIGSSGGRVEKSAEQYRALLEKYSNEDVLAALKMDLSSKPAFRKALLDEKRKRGI